MNQPGPIILVVDDNDEVRDLFSIILRTEGYEVLEASTGRQGLEMAREKRPHLVLLDVRLPDLDGMEVCRQIKSDGDLRDVFVILCSGEATASADKIIGLGTGADEYLAKPVSPNELLARVRTLMRLRDTITALRAGEEYHSRLVEILPDAVCLIDPEGRLLAANAQAVTEFGYASPPDLLQKNIFDLTAKEDRERIRADIVAALKSGFIRNAGYTLLKKNGVSFHVELSATVSLNSTGQPVGLVSVVRDITQREQADKVLRESEERFRQLADNISEVFWMTDVAKSKMIYISPAYEEIWGQTRKSLYDSPKNWMKAVHPEDRERVLEATLKRQISGQYNEVYRIVRPDDSIRWIQDRAFPIREESGKVYRIVGIAEDITRRKEAWDALGESEARKSAIMRVALDGIITIDHFGRILELNSAAEKIFTHNRANLIGKEIMEVIPPFLRTWFKDGLANCFAGEKGPAVGSRIEMIALRTDGSQFNAEFTITQIKLKGHPTFAVYIRDITQRKRAEEELRALPQRIIEAQETERRRVARELHDGINQLIASVKMRLGKVQESLPELKPAAREILLRCDRLLVKALEENRRISHNLHPNDLDNLGLSAACRNFCLEFESRANVKIQRRIASLGRRLPHSVELNLFRIVQEAVNNIEKYAKAKTVKLRIGLHGDDILMTIQDDGCGFDPKKSKSSKKNGHGLGLTNMRERALALGGTCEVTSAPKKGTTIAVKIPREKIKDFAAHRRPEKSAPKPENRGSLSLSQV